MPTLNFPPDQIETEAARLGLPTDPLTPTSRRAAILSLMAAQYPDNVHDGQDVHDDQATLTGSDVALVKTQLIINNQIVAETVMTLPLAEGTTDEP